MFTAEYTYLFKQYLSYCDIPYYKIVDFANWVELKSKIPNWNNIQSLKISTGHTQWTYSNKDDMNTKYLCANGSIYTNPIRNLPADIGYWPTDLINLDLSSNALIHLPDILGYWPDNLEYLHLSYNTELVNLPKQSGYWPPRLGVLYLNNTGICKLPETPKYWPVTLHSLYLYACQDLVTLPVNLVECVNMLHISYIDSSITPYNIPACVMKWLDNIKALDNLSHLTSFNKDHIVCNDIDYLVEKMDKRRVSYLDIKEINLYMELQLNSDTYEFMQTCLGDNQKCCNTKYTIGEIFTAILSLLLCGQPYNEYCNHSLCEIMNTCYTMITQHAKESKDVSSVTVRLKYIADCLTAQNKHIHDNIMAKQHDNASIL